MSNTIGSRTIEALFHRQAALAAFGSFAFHEANLPKVLAEAVRICAEAFDVQFCKVCCYRAVEDDLLIVAGWGWHLGVVGRVASKADRSSPQGRTYVTGQPVIIGDINAAEDLALPAIYEEHGIASTAGVVIPAVQGTPYGVLEVDSAHQHQFDVNDVDLLTGFANVLAEAAAAAARVEALQAALEERALLAEELRRRDGGNLQMITGMLDVCARHAANEAGRDGIDLIVRRVTTLARVYGSLPRVGPGGAVDLAGYLRALCLRLPGLQPERTHPVRVFCRAEPVTLGADETLALGMAVVELVANSYGHAFPDRGGAIAVTLARSGPTTAVLTLDDSGTGLPARLNPSRNELSLIMPLMARIGGTVDTHFNAGRVWNLRFPVPSLGPLQDWGSRRDSRWRLLIVGGLEALPEAGAERAVVDGTPNLQQQVGSASQPAHLL